MHKLRSTRFNANSLDYSLLEFEPLSENFKPGLVGIIFNESYTGVSILIKYEDEITEDMKVRIKVGNIDPLEGKVVWIKKLEPGVYRLGIQYDN